MFSNFKDKDEHLDLLEGVLIDLLKTKWETFVKAKFYRQFYLFAIYFFISLFAFGLRPKAIGSGDDDDPEKAGNSTRDVNANETTNAPVKSLIMHNLTEILCNFSAYHDALVQTELNTTEVYNNSTLPMNEDSDEWTSFSECPLLDISTWENRTKLVAEGLLTIGALYYILSALREARFLGAKMFFENLVMKFEFFEVEKLKNLTIFSSIEHCTVACYVFVFLLAYADCAVFEILLSTRARGSRCSCNYADDFTVFSFLLQVFALNFFDFEEFKKLLSFFRGFKTVGPFVVMIYRMVVGDLLRFVCIYMVFVMGFSQAYYIIFLTFDNTGEEDPEPELNPISSPMESFISMFLMSLGNFGDYYGGMEFTEHETHAKV